MASTDVMAASGEDQWELGTGGEKPKPTAGKILGDLLRLGWPLSTSLVLMQSLVLVTLIYAGQLGDEPLAVAGVGQQLMLITGLGMMLMGSCDALATLATQAYGAGRPDLFPAIWQRAVLFNAVHCIPLTAIILLVPSAFRAADRTESFTTSLAHYFLICLPLFPLQAVLFPLEYLLIAQKRTWPVMVMAAVGLVTQIACNQLMVSTWEWGLTGNALALVVAYLTMVVWLVCYNLGAGLGRITWGTQLLVPTCGQLAEYCALAYSSIGMKAIEYYSYTFLTIFAGFLPNPDVTQAASAVCVEVAAVMFVPFLGLGMATTTLAGNAFGANNPEAAKKVAITVPFLHPLVMAILILVFVPPASNRWIVELLAEGGSEELQESLQWLLRWLMLHITFSGTQVLSGAVLTGAGLQRVGLFTNLVVFFLVTEPLVVYLSKFAGYGLRGLWYGQLSAPILQTIVFVTLVARLKWQKVADKAVARAEIQHHGGGSEGEPLLAGDKEGGSV